MSQQGVPIRLELGPRDLAGGSTVAVRRDTGVKSTLTIATLSESVPELLNTIQADMLSRARKVQDEHIKVIYEWKDFVPALNSNCICVIPWCENMSCEEHIKERSAKECVDFHLIFFDVVFR